MIKSTGKTVLAVASAVIWGATVAAADIACVFDKYCESGNQCSDQIFELTVENGSAPAFVWDGPTRKALVFAQMSGGTGAFTSTTVSGSSVETWALTMSSEQASLSLTYAVNGFGADVVIYLGQCDGSW